MYTVESGGLEGESPKVLTEFLQHGCAPLVVGGDLAALEHVVAVHALPGRPSRERLAAQVEQPNPALTGGLYLVDRRPCRLGVH